MFKVVLVLASVSSMIVSTNAQEPSVLRIGMIGLDTSHVPAFAKVFNNPAATGDLAGFKVVVGYPGGTEYAPSKIRVEKFTLELRDMGIEIVDTIPKLLEKVDCVLLESVDGRIHLSEAKQVIEAGKPLFIDKPIAGSLADAIAILELAAERKVPCFSSSSIRFGAGMQALKQQETLGEIVGAATWGPCSYQEGVPDMFFYGVHGIDNLFFFMGTGCESVSRIQTDDADLITGVWQNGRVGTYRGIRRHKSEFGATVFGTKGIATTNKGDNYEPLCREIAKFFKTKQPPVTAAETLEIFAFMEAADESHRQHGKPIKLQEIIQKARATINP
jgi:predicted dehydrogenase